VSISAPALACDGFDALGVPPQLTAALARAGITEPFPIQAATLPDALSGRDVCGKAPTGSGKTLAFGLAMVSRLVASPGRDGSGRRRHRDGGRPSGLVLVPTRELAAQVEEVLGLLAGAVGASVMSVYGGVAYGKQLSALRRGVDVLIACPGRLEDLVSRGSIDLAFVDMVVIDEADRMADMGFLPAVRRLVDRTSDTRQTMLFSATLDGPIDKLVRDYQRSPVRHEVVAAETDQGEVHHHFWSVTHEDRVAVTAEAVTARGPAIVFCRTKHGADRLSQRLARSGLSTAAIHGDRSQSQRERALAAFRSGRLDVLVATDVAARGIHVDDVPLVVHYDPPADATDYVHRSGRTGRAGADGIVVSLIGDVHVVGTKKLQRQLGLAPGISSPNISALPTVGDPTRTGAAGARLRSAAAATVKPHGAKPAAPNRGSHSQGSGHHAASKPGRRPGPPRRRRRPDARSPPRRSVAAPTLGSSPGGR